MSVERTRRAGGARWSIGAVLCGVLMVGAVSPAWGDAGSGAGPGAGAPVLGGFALGDAIEGLIDERDGALTVSVPAGGVMLSWDSRAAGAAGASGLPAGWGFGLARVLTEGGVRVSPASGGVYELDASQPSGLAGYGLSDLRFEDLSGGDPAEVMLAARSDGVVGERAVRFRLAELGGTVTSFDAAGLPLARVGATGERTDWVHDDAGRLVRVVDADGVVTELDWDAEPGVLLVRPAANVPNAAADGVERVWRVELDTERVAAVVDPLGGRVEVGVRDGLVDRVSGVSGAVTEVEWQRFDDGVPRVDVLRVVDRSGAVLSSRTWSRFGSASSSGWPTSANAAAGPFGVQDPALTYATELSDGATKVRSTYTGLHLLQTREVVATTSAGETTVQEQAFTYPELPGGVFDPAQLPRAWSKPARVELTSHAADGASRSIGTAYGYDEYGRAIEQTAPDGTVTRTEYDEVAAGSGPPIGLPVLQTVTGADDAMQQTEHRLNDAHTAVIETETRTQVPGHEPTTIGLTEFDVAADGFVTQQREHPGGDRSAAPVVTNRREATDLTAGTTTSSETVGVGTPGESTIEQTVSLSHGGVIEQVDAVGSLSSASYDALGRPVEQTDASGLTTRTTYETMHGDGRNATTVETPDRVVTTEVRDALGRVTQTIDNIDDGMPVDGHVRLAEHRRYPADRPGTIEVTDAWGATTTVQQDLFGREVAATTAAGLTKLTIYNDVANTVTTALTPTGELDGAALVSTARMDDTGRTIGTSGTRADGEPVPDSATTYDALGRELTATDCTLASSTRYDAAGHPVQRTLTPQGSTEPMLTADRRFDEAGHSVEKTIRDDRHARSGGAVEIDSLGRTTTTTDQAGRIGTVAYSPDGLPLREVTASGRVIETAYDAQTRRPIGTTTTSPAGAVVSTSTERDPVTGRVTAVYDAADRAGTEITYAYDAFGNVTTQRYPDGAQITHEYDAHGRKLSTTDVTGAVTRYVHDDAGLLTAATQYEDAEPGAAVLASVSYTYDAFARVRRLDRDTGVSTTYDYTSAGEIAEETTARDDGETLSNREYAYDELTGTLVQRIDRVRDDPTGELAATTTTYRYDAMRQLTASTEHDGGSTDAPIARTTEYGLMVTGDIETETVIEAPGTADETRTERAFEYSPLGELIAITTNGERRTQEYDGAGNLVRAADGTQYVYDAANRPVATTTAEGATTTFAYWADGTRRSIERDDPGAGARSTVELYWDGRSLVNERHAVGVEATGTAGEVSYLLGATRHARTIQPTSAGTNGSATTSHFTSDRHGNVTELTDETGAVTERYRYSDYGVELAPGAAALTIERNPFRYAGEFTDPDGSQFLTERLYLPHLMRFASDDRAPEHNDYAFGHLNPIMMVDPSGRTPSADTIAGWVLTGLGAAASVASIAGAVLTGGTSMSLLGIAGWMVEGGALAATAMTVADQVTPFLSERQRLGLNITEIVLGAASTIVSRIGFAEYGVAESKTRRASQEFFDVLAQRRVAWLPHLAAPQFTQGVNLLLAERAVLADDLLTFGVRTWADLPATITTNLSAARTSLQTAFTQVGGDGVSWVAEALGRFRRTAAGGREAVKRNWLTRSLLWREELAAVDRVVGEHAAGYAALKTMRANEFAFFEELRSMKLLIADLTPTPGSVTKVTNADLLQMLDAHLVPKYAPEPQRLVRLERAQH